MVTETWWRVKDWNIDREAYYAILAGFIIVALVGVFRLSLLIQGGGEGNVWIEEGAFRIGFLEAHEASYAALMGGSIYYPISCAKLPKRDNWAYLFFKTQEEARGFGFTPAKGC